MTMAIGSAINKLKAMVQPTVNYGQFSVKSKCNHMNLQKTRQDHGNLEVPSIKSKQWCSQL